jgi:adenylate cyclase
MKTHRRELWEPLTEAHGGRVVGTAGDAILMEFASAVAAVECSIALQDGMIKRNRDLPDARHMLLRVGVNIGEVIVDGDDIFGDGVNLAARLQEIADPGCMAISDKIYAEVVDKLDAVFVDDGEHAMKNIARPVRVWRWLPEGAKPEVAVADLPRLSLPAKPSIAVLPFDNLSGDPEQEYFVDGVTEDIITALSRIRWFFVIARNSTFTFKGRAVDVQTVATDLGVRYVLEGSARKAGNRVRITAQLIDGATGNHLWAERYDRDLEDIFTLQDEITETVIGAIEPQIAQAELERAKAKRPENLDAWDLHLRARAQVYLYTEEAVAEAVSLSLRAIELDPELARAHATLALAYQRQLLLNYADDRATVREKLMQAAKRAVALDKEDAEGHTVLGLALWNWKLGDVDEALSVIRTAVQLGPSHAFAHSSLGLALGTSGFAEEALEHHQAAIRLSPRDPQLALFMSRYANSCINAHKYDQAVELSKQAIRHSGGDLWLTFVEAATALAHLGRIDEAKDMVARMKAVRADASVTAVRNALAFRDNELEQHYMDGLLLAGLPE